jgi:hypothetical protein
MSTVINNITIIVIGKENMDNEFIKKIIDEHKVKRVNKKNKSKLIVVQEEQEDFKDEF